jgi:hypothetical protein
MDAGYLERVAAVGRTPMRLTGATKDPKGKRIGISLNRRQCLA